MREVWVVLLVVAVVVAVGIVLASPRCGEFSSGTFCEKTRYIPGIALGVPGEQVGFETIAFKNVHITATKDVVQAGFDWVNTQKFGKNVLAKIESESADGKQGALLVCFSDALKNFSDGILAWMGVTKVPERAITINGLYCLLFYGSIK
jgi:hypothetical protein